MVNILARDIFLNALLVFMALVVILLLLVNPPTQDSTAEPPGNLAFTIVWPAGNDDIDMWLMGPGEGSPIGYSNKGGVALNLLRDDLGEMTDPLPANVENAYSRGILAGEYVINVHSFRTASPLPIKVHVEVRLILPTTSVVLVSTTVDLVREGQEITALRFRLDTDGRVEPGSVHSVFQPLRSAGK